MAKNIHKLKGWFFLPDAAERISSGLDDSVTVDDVIQLVIEGHLPLSWYARHVPARKVVPFTSLHGRGLHSGYAQLISEKDESFKDALIASEGWEAVDGDNTIIHIEGPFKLELQYCGALKDWVHSHLTHTGGELITLDGFFVSDEEENIFQIMEHASGGKYATPDGIEKEMESYYFPSGQFPEESELIIQKIDIENFEKKYSNISGEKENRKNESAAERKQKLESWFNEECRLRGHRGALQRTAGREGIKRQTLSDILNRDD